MMLGAGVPMTQALSLVADAVDNSYMHDRIVAMRRGIESGESMLRVSNQSGLFTPLVLQMVAVGEETGQIDQLLNDAADFYEGEVDYDLKNLTAKLEPILIGFVAGVVDSVTVVIVCAVRVVRGEIVLLSDLLLLVVVLRALVVGVEVGVVVHALVRDFTSQDKRRAVLTAFQKASRGYPPHHEAARRKAKQRQGLLELERCHGRHAVVLAKAAGCHLVQSARSSGLVLLSGSTLDCFRDEDAAAAVEMVAHRRDAVVVVVAFVVVHRVVVHACCEEGRGRGRVASVFGDGTTGLCEHRSTDQGFGNILEHSEF